MQTKKIPETLLNRRFITLKISVKVDSFTICYQQKKAGIKYLKYFHSTSCVILKICTIFSDGKREVFNRSFVIDSSNDTKTYKAANDDSKKYLQLSSVNKVISIPDTFILCGFVVCIGGDQGNLPWFLQFMIY